MNVMSDLDKEEDSMSQLAERKPLTQSPGSIESLVAALAGCDGQERARARETLIAYRKAGSAFLDQNACRSR